MRPEVTGRIRRLELTARRVVEGFLSGMHRSPYFGQSIEFLQHRQYTPGDEIRHIDWKVYARQDRLHIKQYEEETNLRLTLLVDRSGSMAYGDGESNKFDYSASIAASLAYLALASERCDGADHVRHPGAIQRACEKQSASVDSNPVVARQCWC